MTDVARSLLEQAEHRLARVRGLVGLYETLPGPISGHAALPESDVLRAAVIFLHATFEDFLRSLVASRVSHVSKEYLARIPFLGGDGRKTTLNLGDLNDYREQSVASFIKKSVEDHLNRQTYNNPGDVKRALQEIGMPADILFPYASQLHLLTSRRHLIAHRLDYDDCPDQGDQGATAISQETVNAWVDMVERLVKEIAGSLQ